MAAIAWCELARSEPFLLRLIQARVQAGLSQKQAARLFGLSNVTLSRYECGARMIPRHRIAQAAEFYGVTEAWLLDGTPSLSNQQIDHIRKVLNGIPAETIDRAIDLLSSLAGVRKLPSL